MNLCQGMSERQIQKIICDRLKAYELTGLLHYERTNVFAGQIKRRNGSIGYMKSSSPGTSDIKVWLKGGKSLFIEVKSEKGGLSPIQSQFMAKISRLGYDYHVVRCVKDLEDILNKAGVQV